MSQTTPPLIRLHNVGVSYNKGKNILSRARYQVLKSVSFTVYPGESLGVLGRNGAGKTTLLKLLAGIIEPDSGTLERTTSSIAMLSLQLGFIPHLSGRENAILGGIIQGNSRQQVIAKLPEIRAYSELGEFWEEPVSTYSSGMTTRLGFSVAIHVDTDVLLIDEVLGVGDAQFRAKSAKTLHAKMASDHTVILVSHNVDTVRKLCQRAVWIDEGVTRMEGDVHAVVEAYNAHALG